MNRFSFVVLLLAGLMLVVSSAEAQPRRPVETFFIRPHVGVSSYVGDYDKAFFSSEGGFPYNVGIEGGYQFSLPLSFGVGYQLGKYPGINFFDQNEQRHTVRALLRYTFGGETGLAPYLQTGAHVSFGKTATVAPSDGILETNETSYGALFGLGIDVPLSDALSFFIDVTTHPSFPDDGIDGADLDAAGSFDLLTAFGAGLKINFQSATVPPRIIALDGPEELEAGRPGSYSATTNGARATQPVTYRWAWGDGTFSDGVSASHAYAAPGTYEITFEASNAGGSDRRTKLVRVVTPPEPAVIISVTADPVDPDTRTPVRFRASVRGDTPLVYNWTFGDQQSSTEAAPVHTFEQPGTYAVTLTLTNDYGSDTRSMSITVQPFEAAFCREIAEMTPVFFDRNSSTINDDARGRLDENLQILQQCPNLDARIVGFASPTERNPQRLSEDRARAVEQYYTRRGVSPSRLITRGDGAADGVTSKKGGAEAFQRVDTIPVR